MWDSLNTQFNENLRNEIQKMKDIDQQARFKVIEFHKKNGWDKSCPDEIGDLISNKEI